MHTESHPQRETALRKDTPSSLTTPSKVNHRYREIGWTYTETLSQNTPRYPERQLACPQHIVTLRDTNTHT